MRTVRLVMVAGLVIVGVALAWPFRRDRSSLRIPADSHPVVDVPLRGRDVALAIGPYGEQSPATMRDSQEDPLASATGRALRPDLESLGLPPVLPQDFGPPVSQERVTVRRNWQPARLKLPSSAPKLRRHRLTDGDSLERLAERYLGSSGRADEIFEINRDLLPAPDLLPLGRIIRIPPREADEALQAANLAE